LAGAIETGEVDPSFEAMENQIIMASDRHRVDAANHLKALTAIQTKVLIATPIVFTLGVVLVIFFWRILRTYQRRVEESLSREASNIPLALN